MNIAQKLIFSRSLLWTKVIYLHTSQSITIICRWLFAKEYDSKREQEGLCKWIRAWILNWMQFNYAHDPFLFAFHEYLCNWVLLAEHSQKLNFQFTHISIHIIFSLLPVFSSSIFFFFFWSVTSLLLWTLSCWNFLSIGKFSVQQKRRNKPKPENS